MLKLIKMLKIVKIKNEAIKKPLITKMLMIISLLR